MQIDMVTELGATRYWQIELAEQLRRDGHEVHVSATDTAGTAVPGLDFVEMIERIVYKIPAGDQRLRERVAITDQAASAAADLIIDLSAEPTVQAKDAPRLVPLFDGMRGETAAVSTLLEQRSPRIEIGLVQSESDRLRSLAAGAAAIEMPHCLTRSLASVHRRTAALLRMAVRRFAAGGTTPTDIENTAPDHIALLAPARFVASSLASKIAARLSALSRRQDHWRIGWRRTNGDAIGDTLEWPGSDFTFVPDDATRYYADPFVFVDGGVTHVFCEEFPYATGKAIISAFTIGRDGSVTAPRPVLETGSHMSYPMVFRHAGAIWMIPETSSASRIELYRAERFPDRWTRAAILVDNVNASDATIATFGNRLWLFASIAENGSSTWDALGLFHAQALEGPWSAHPTNPVLVDAGAARPAGQMFERAGRLVRPAQDCRTGYGAGLAFCTVARLDTENFEQDVTRRFAPPTAWRARGLHTYNRADDIEVIDCVGAQRRT